jgi:hypothetical protein
MLPRQGLVHQPDAPLHPKKNLSSGGQETLHRLSPLLSFTCDFARLVGTCSRQIRRRADKERNVFAGAFVPDLFIKREGLTGKVSAHVQQHPVIEPWSPQTSRRPEAFCSIQFDVVIAQDASARVARGLVRIDEENFLADESLSATQRWLVHTTPPRLVSPLRERWLGRIVRAEGEGVNRNRDRGSGHPLALPHYGQELIATTCCGNNQLSGRGTYYDFQPREESLAILKASRCCGSRDSPSSNSMTRNSNPVS